jgi:hypothetical protein
MIRKGNSKFSIFNLELWTISAKRKSSGNSKLAVPGLFVLALIAGFLLGGAAQAAPITSGADFLLNPVGARPDGMGEAYSAVANDLYALSFNPAGLAGIRQTQVGYGREEFVAGVHYDFFGVGAPVDGLGVLSLGYIGLGIDPFNSTADSSAPLVSEADMAFFAAWAKSFYPFEDGASLQAGFTVKYIDRQLAGIQGTGLAFDAGFRYLTLQDLAFSASLMNMGPGVQFSSLEPLPMLFDLGAACKILDTRLHSLTLAGDASWNLLSQTQQYGMGLEYWFQGEFAVRAGYLFNSEVEGPTVGAGIKLDFIELDYAFQPDNNLGTVNRLSGLLRFDGPSASLDPPVSPQNLEVHPTTSGFKVSWNISDRQDQSYVVTAQPLGGRAPYVTKPFGADLFVFNDKGSHRLFSVQVRATDQSGRWSQPSRTVYVISGGAEGMDLPMDGVSAEANPAGLNLSWEIPKDYGVSGYNLYCLTPSGKVDKLNLAPKKNNRILLGREWVRNGVRYIVTGLGSDGRVEKIVGSCFWDPSEGELQALSQGRAIKLQASLARDQQIFLAWNSFTGVKAYSLFYSSQPDGIYEFYGNLTDPKPSALLQMVTEEKEIHFLLTARSWDGKWVACSNDSKVSMSGEP